MQVIHYEKCAMGTFINDITQFQGRRSSFVAHWLSVPGDRGSYTGGRENVSSFLFELQSYFSVIPKNCYFTYP